MQLVAGSAVTAFEEVCGERIDLIHKNYRKLCNLLVDVDEWGQLAITQMLTRYARTQFLNPNVEDQEVTEAKFYSSTESDSDSDDEDEDEKEKKRKRKEEKEKKKKSMYVMDSDHRLLLQSTKPLLQSRNAAVSNAFCLPVDYRLIGFCLSCRSFLQSLSYTFTLHRPPSIPSSFDLSFGC